MQSYRTQLVAATGLAALATRAPSDEGTSAEAVDRKQVTISSETFEIAVPYREGHVLNAAEASQLNQTYLENIRNNVAGKIKAAREAAEKAGTEFSMDTPVTEGGLTLREVCADYAANYEFGIRTTRSAEPVDPVEREARAIAREAINGLLRKQGVKRKDISDEAFEEALQKHSKNPAIVKEAQRRVKAKESLGLDELDLSGDAGSDETAEGGEG